MKLIWSKKEKNDNEPKEKKYKCKNCHKSMLQRDYTENNKLCYNCIDELYGEFGEES